MNTYWAYTRPECISFNIPVKEHLINNKLAQFNVQTQKLSTFFQDPSGQENSHFFQEGVFIEGIRNSPCKLVVIQVPEIESRDLSKFKPIQFPLQQTSTAKIQSIDSCINNFLKR
jgi:hypothetical protein